LLDVAKDISLGTTLAMHSNNLARAARALGPDAGNNNLARAARALGPDAGNLHKLARRPELK